MAVNPIFPTPLQTRQLVTFFDPLNTGNYFIPKLNPIQMIRKPNSVRKYTMTTNSTAVILGDYEYPPKEISITWNQIDDADFQSLREFTFISPITFVDNNDNGYLGVLVIDEAEQLANVTLKAWSVKASFLVVSPYDGITTTLPKLSNPSLSDTKTTSGGYITGAQTIYVWNTVFTPTGESVPGTALTLTSTSGDTAAYFTVTWTAPTSGWYRKTRLYWNSVNTSTTATLLGEVLAGLSQQWTIYTIYTPYNSINPQLYNQAYTGYWSGGLWTPQTT
jgi:hypothetical protein